MAMVEEGAFPEVGEDLLVGEEAGDGFEDEEEQLEDDGQAPGTGPYETLAAEGPQNSAGSGGHPDECLPCTFYCFTRRGCNRGMDCRFCHLAHQSKLQQRRETWKKQQREKRKAIRERVAAEAVVRRGGFGGGGKGGAPAPQPMPLAGAGKNPDMMSSNVAMKPSKNAAMKSNRQQRPLSEQGSGGNQPSLFCYPSGKQIVTVGQEVEFAPQVMTPGAFRLATSLPPGLTLDASTGVIFGTPSQGQPTTSVVVEMDVPGGSSVRAFMDVEVIDFTRGGYVVGHMSEFERGRFMLLLYTPEDGEPANDMDVSNLSMDYSVSGCGVNPSASFPGYFGGMGMPNMAQKAAVQGQRNTRKADNGGQEKLNGPGGGAGQDDLSWW